MKLYRKLWQFLILAKAKIEFRIFMVTLDVLIFTIRAAGPIPAMCIWKSHFPNLQSVENADDCKVYITTNFIRKGDFLSTENQKVTL